MSDKNFYKALKIIKESGLVIEKKKLRSEMTPEELEQARAKSRERRAARKDPKNKFEKVVKLAMEKVDEGYLATKDHKPFFIPFGDGQKYEIKEVKEGWGAGMHVYVKSGGGWFEEGGMRKFAKIANEILYSENMPLHANENWSYSSGTSPSGVKYCMSIYFKKKEALEVDSRGYVKNWSKGYSAVDIDYNGKTYTVKKAGVIDSRIRDNGSRQMCGYSNDVLWVSDDKKLGVRVHTGCIHPALGEDIDARVVQGQELQDLLTKLK